MSLEKDDVHVVAPEVVVSFLEKILPFDTLDRKTLVDIARHCRIDFFPKGTRLLTAGETELTSLYIIQQGGVKAFLEDDQGEVALKDFRGEGAYIGALGLIRGTRANLNIEMVEDTFCFLLPREIFLRLLDEKPSFAQYYLKSFSEKVVNTAYKELRHHKVSRRSHEDLYLFSIRAGEVVKTLRKVSADLSIQEAAVNMARYRVGSLLIHNAADPEEILGIITDRDLRSKVVAAGLDYNLPVRDIMTGPVQKVLSQTICFDVLLKMMSTGIHHLAVEQGGRVIGVITSHDVMLLQGHSPYYLFKEIRSQARIVDLYALAQKVPDVVRGLIKEGAKAGNITQMIAILNDHILERMLTLLEQEMGPPPLPYCWLLMGSEGRREQTFKTDQDNAILYADPRNDAEAEAAALYFKEFADRAIDHLVNCGYPLCPGEIMARNPRWCQPLSVWKSYFDHWIDAPDPDELLNATIFFDFRAGYGAVELAEELRDHLTERAVKQEIFLLHLARQCMGIRIPLSVFKNFIVSKDGKHKNRLDIKAQGVTPFSNFARILALKYGIKETNTLARFKVLADAGHISDDIWKVAHDAYELQMQQRLVHQLQQIEEGVHPDNYIDPAHLSDLERRMLKDAFAVIERLYSLLGNMYPAG
ncbi:MAG: cyclic nucleotide-binding/CBS domain-containing protein [Desulfobulbaceae bacterium]|uniref:Cyclic nucleotide-binding/CBS domain-containing protein n=1 Tax=Candidatus Desulfatifera sulfidica TaxID=2841691 RepID=A0A8J6NB77_9BACT|nr:cyclic nucleotide-binding/CBS domain-containing protein [Candidatus Desulfatifera sulfidica]